MRQMAMYYTRTNASRVIQALNEYFDPSDFDEDFYTLFPNDQFEAKLVVVKSILEDGTSVFSHVIRESMFHANAKTVEPLNDETYVEVTQL